MRVPKSTSSALYRPGEGAPVSGIYRVIHDGHRVDHLVTVVKGDELPMCRKCRNRVRFRLWVEADYLNQSWDLSGPNLSLIQGNGPGRPPSE